jgi:predicted XRE-type DNA-binding protein
MTGKLELKKGSDNVFRDLGIPDADALLMKADLAAAIIAVLNKRKLTARAAGKVAGVAHTDIVNIRNVKLGRFSIERLVRILNALDQRVELRITKVPGRVRSAA